ncbi:MAG: DUF262 domain-containing HNH endonuclease family protein [Hyphomicrobiaceae bacterium]
MPAAHTAEAMTVGELLGGKRQFSIPSYQRDYSWTSKEADQLIDDLLLARQEIESAPQAPKALYLSLMIIMDDTTPRRAISRLRRGTGVPSEVIDGKQRLTTLTMLIALLRDLLGDEGAWLQHYLVETGRSRLWPREAPRLLLEEHEQEFLTAHVLPRGANLAPSPRDIAHQSVKRMRSVRDHLRTRLRKLERPLLVNLAELLIERCAVTAIVPNDITAGFRMFVTANFRGKALSTSDIVKAELVGSLEPQERRKASDAWGELRNRLEPPPDNPVEAKNAASFDNLLSYVHKLRCKPGSTIFQGIEDLAGTAPSPLAFVKDTLEPLAGIMLVVKRAAHAGSTASPAINRTLATLNWLPANDWVPVAMQTLHTHVRSADEALGILKLVHRLAYTQAILGHGTPLRDSRYRRCAAIIADRGDFHAKDSPLVLTADEIDQLARFLSGNLYRKRSNHCKAVLAWIASTGDVGKPLPALDDVSVEHILPKTPIDVAYWRERFPDAVVREHAIRSLGNLALVPTALNKSVGNLSFPEKRAMCLDRFAASPFDTTQMLANITDWTPEAVLARETMMLERAAKAWGIDLTGRSKLAGLLKR